jgi:Zn finger protein HypA/HybF involved in hydrogenase expression
MKREEAIEILSRPFYMARVPRDILEAHKMAIDALEQEPKTGHWIDITNKNGTVIAIRCDNCKESPKHAIRSDYCPKCGIRMKSGVNE